MKSSQTKKEVVELVAKKTGLTKKQADQAISATFEVIQEGLLDGKKFTMVGFGTFKTSVRQPRTGINPQTGESMVIPGKLVARFRPGKKLDDALNSIKSLSKWVKQ